MNGYRAAALLVAATHFGFVAYVVLGGLLVRRHPRTLPVHLAAIAWAIGIVTLGQPCPLTALEDHFRRLAGDPVPSGGFVDRYLEGVLYPSDLTRLVQVAVAAAIVLSYARWWRRRA